eukprot:scaffold114032_cov72-Phaeocystis_antarctica.AAC.2
MFRQQHALKVDERAAEVMHLDCHRVDLQRIALYGQNEDAFTVYRRCARIFDQVQAVLHVTKCCGLLPLARDRAAMLASEREDFQAVHSQPGKVSAIHKQLLAYNRQPKYIIERQQKPVAKLHRLSVERENFVRRVLIALRSSPILESAHAEEKPAGCEHWCVSMKSNWVLVGCDLSASMSEAGDASPVVTIPPYMDVHELLVGGDPADERLVEAEPRHGIQVAIHDAPARRHQGSPRTESSLSQTGAEESRTPLAPGGAVPRRWPSNRLPTASTRRPPRRPPAAAAPARMATDRSRAALPRWHAALPRPRGGWLHLGSRLQMKPHILLRRVPGAACARARRGAAAMAPCLARSPGSRVVPCNGTVRVA